VEAPRTLFEKIWSGHLVADIGDGIGLLAIDRVFLHERTGSIALKSLRQSGRTVKDPARVFCTMDHIVDTFPGRSDETRMPGGKAFITETREAALEAENRVLREQVESLRLTDDLTGLPNRRRFRERAESERQALRRTGRSFALIRVDLDHLRAINHRYGSECGDRVLVAVASTLRDTLRERDVAARWGSEEFVLLLPETDLDGARTLAEKVRSRIASLRVVHGDRELEVTCTLGLSEADLGDSIDALAARADAALVAGKSAGGDRVEVWTPQTPAGG